MEPQPPHDCNVSTHLPVRHRDGSLSLRCCDCGREVSRPFSTPPIEGGQGRSAECVEHAGWIALIILAVIAALLLAGIIP